MLVIEEEVVVAMGIGQGGEEGCTSMNTHHTSLPALLSHDQPIHLTAIIGVRDGREVSIGVWQGIGVVVVVGEHVQAYTSMNTPHASPPLPNHLSSAIIGVWKTWQVK
ncbi:hypothetical protein E2C01_089908 [Portunus trituberculatus]|uniref:Uncharacterized protein n=1 Tax=Portunus trituberculatus TaxID=210409 RepID=A0A5B7JNQ1_PORTR|nr:hypothetical protein [Portunus trituberculatus]